MHEREMEMPSTVATPGEAAITWEECFEVVEKYNASLKVHMRGVSGDTLDLASHILKSKRTCGDYPRFLIECAKIGYGESVIKKYVRIANSVPLQDLRTQGLLHGEGYSVLHEMRDLDAKQIQTVQTRNKRLLADSEPVSKAEAIEWAKEQKERIAADLERKRQVNYERHKPRSIPTIAAAQPSGGHVNGNRTSAEPPVLLVPASPAAPLVPASPAAITSDGNTGSGGKAGPTKGFAATGTHKTGCTCLICKTIQDAKLEDLGDENLPSVELYVTVSLANATKTYDERIEAFVERLRHDAEAICKGEFAFIKPVICLEVPEGTSPLDDDDFAPTQIEVEAAVVQWGLPVEAAKERLHEFVKWSPRDYLTKYGTEQSDEKFDNPSAGTAQLPLAS